MTENLTIPGHWAEHALCAQADPDAWFPDKGRSAPAVIAKQICGRCPVRGECLEYALSGADTWGAVSTGIWGGTTPSRLRQARKVAAA